MIKNYNDFITALLDTGFSGAVGGKDDGVFGLFRYGWGADAGRGDLDAPIWHTGDPDTDPWEWRMRVLDERDDIAYAKMFFKKAGYITKEWYPYFLAARRGSKTFIEEYSNGTVSLFAKRIYEVVADTGGLPLDEIKRAAGFGGADKAKFDSALNELQMKLYLTMCGRRQKISRRGEEYGWASTMFCTVEEFWPSEVIDKADGINPEDAESVITERILKLNPAADMKKVVKFIRG